MLFTTDLHVEAEFAAVYGKNNLAPEVALMLAVLADAVDVVTGAGKRSEKAVRGYLVEETTRWFFDPAPPDHWPFTFRNICERFHYDGEKIIAALRLVDEPAKAQPLRPHGRRQIFGERKGRARYDCKGERREARGVSSGSDSSLAP